MEEANEDSKSNAKLSFTNSKINMKNTNYHNLTRYFKILVN